MRLEAIHVHLLVKALGGSLARQTGSAAEARGGRCRFDARVGDGRRVVTDLRVESDLEVAYGSQRKRVKQ